MARTVPETGDKTAFENYSDLSSPLAYGLARPSDPGENYGRDERPAAASMAASEPGETCPGDGSRLIEKNSIRRISCDFVLVYGGYKPFEN